MLYDLNRLLFDMKNSDEVVSRMYEDIDSVLSEYDLTDEEVSAIKAKDDKKLIALGGRGNMAFSVLRLYPEMRYAQYFKIR
jgi:Aromatic-ring-opening dioxygenase LigAB, LigA subunit